MVTSPFAFLRGSAPFFYELLRAVPWLAGGPPGEGWIVGDLHLENFGAFRTSAPPDRGKARDTAQEVVFDLNDFDEAIRGPWRLDLLRMATSALLAARQAGVSWGGEVDCVRILLASYAEALRQRMPPGAPPRLIEDLIVKARKHRTEQQILACSQGQGDRRVFLLGGEFQPAPEERADAEEAFRGYAEQLTGGDPEQLARFRVLDVAFRVAGTGSLGSERFAVLVAGKGAGWLFDMKEQDGSSAAILLGGEAEDPARQVMEATRQCISSPTRMLGTTRFRGRSMLVRRLSAQESKLRIAGKNRQELPEVARYLGACIAAAHLRGAQVDGSARWTEEALAELLERALVLAGLHEAGWRAFCRLAS